MPEILTTIIKNLADKQIDPENPAEAITIRPLERKAILNALAPHLPAGSLNRDQESNGKVPNPNST